MPLAAYSASSTVQCLKKSSVAISFSALSLELKVHQFFGTRVKLRPSFFHGPAQTAPSRRTMMYGVAAGIGHTLVGGSCCCSLGVLSFASWRLRLPYLYSISPTAIIAPIPIVSFRCVYCDILQSLV